MPYLKGEPLTTQEHLSLLHPRDSQGTVFLCTHNGGWEQRPTPIGDLLDASLRTHLDTYVTQNTFSGSRRTVQGVESLSSLYVDLDAHDTNAPVDSLVAGALSALCASDVPPPSYVTESGRGAHLVWLLEPVPAKALPRWRACQSNLVDRLLAFGADPAATDAARVLRVSGTRNTRAGKTAQAYSLTGERYSFDALARVLLPYSPEQVRAYKARQELDSSHRRACPGLGLVSCGRYTRFYELVLADLHALLSLRGLEVLPSGHRDEWLFAFAVAARHVYGASGGRLFTYQTAARLTPWSVAEMERHLRHAFTRPEPYKRSGQSVIRALRITQEEQERLSVLVSDELKLRRKRVRDREAKRDARRYSTNETQTRIHQRSLSQKALSCLYRSRGHTEQETARKVGLSPRQIRRYSAGTRPNPSHTIIRSDTRVPPSALEGGVRALLMVWDGPTRLSEWLCEALSRPPPVRDGPGRGPP